METVSGQIQDIRYQNDVNGWTVATLDGDCPKSKVADLTVVGLLPGVTQGMTLHAAGEWRDHPKFGWQFSVHSYQTDVPSDAYSMAIYLEHVVGGIGRTLAERIVEHFGASTAQVMGDPQALREVYGIGRRKAKDIADSWLAHQHERQALEGILAFLVKHSISPTYGRKIFAEFGFDAIKTLHDNPYALTRIGGIAFKKADAIARAVGMRDDDPRRLQAALTFALKEASKRGHCYVPQDELVCVTAGLCPIPSLSQGEALDALSRELDVLISWSARASKGEVVAEGNRVYLARLYRAEAGVAEHLSRLASEDVSRKLHPYTLRSEDQITRELPVPPGVAYTPEQVQAILQALRAKVSIITGGPGTGKSTIVQAIVNLALDAQAVPVLLAPTGKAADRLAEVTGEHASTIHRALGVDPETGRFLCNEHDPLEGDIFIVDEASMLDVSLAYALLRAIPSRAHLVLVGDVDQLPSVGPGNVLKDVIASDCFPVTWLTAIFRQSEESLIIPNAHRINRGELPHFAKGGDGDFYLFPAQTDDEAADWIVDLVSQRIPEVLGAPAGEIQVLSPQKKTSAGTDVLNKRLQATLNPEQPGVDQIEVGSRVLRAGDRVIQIRNDYDKNVFNGQTGTILSIGKDDKGSTVVYIAFGQDTNAYTKKDLSDIRLAYAMTVHKSQGSEFRVVVMPVINAHYIMLRRNLLYTGVTRAREIVVLVGNAKALTIALRNNQVMQRQTSLKQRIQSTHKANAQDKEIFNV